MYHFTDGGLDNVWLANGYVERDTCYGNAVSFSDLDGLVGAVCAALVQKPGRLTGAEFRYLRTALQLSQKLLGHLVGYSEQAVAKWEKTGRVPKAVDALLRMIFGSAHGDQAKHRPMTRMLDVIDNVSNSRIVMSYSGGQWNSSFHDIEENVPA